MAVGTYLFEGGGGFDGSGTGGRASRGTRGRIYIFSVPVLLAATDDGDGDGDGGAVAVASKLKPCEGCHK